MRVIQFVPTLAYGDGVGNHVIAIDRYLKSLHYNTMIYCEAIDPRVEKGIAKHIYQMPSVTKDDVVIYHAAIASQLTYVFAEMKARKVMIYHNITPPEFFKKNDPACAKACAEGLKQMQYLADKVEYCIADSEFNKQDLIRMGYSCPIDVCPLIISFSDYEKEPNEGIIQQYTNDGYTNLLFVGRIVPNKKQENVIRAFYFYHKYFNSKSRLFLVGSGAGPYMENLKDYILLLGLEDSVIFTGHTRFDHILAYYRLADVFVCMSEHEGFCVPLLEAMCFDVPVIALDRCAVPYTLGDSGILLESNKPSLVAETIDQVVTNVELKADILEKQRTRLKDFDQQVVAEKFKNLIMNFLGYKIKEE